MISDEYPDFSVEAIIVNATQVEVGQFILNLGQVVGRRDEGAFVFLTYESERWDATRGIQVHTTETRFFHSTDEVWIQG